MVVLPQPPVKSLRRHYREYNGFHRLNGRVVVLRSFAHIRISLLRRNKSENGLATDGIAVSVIRVESYKDVVQAIREKLEAAAEKYAAIAEHLKSND